MLKFLFTVVRRDVLLAVRRRGDWLTAQFFFVMVVSMFPLGVGPEPAMLRSIGPGVVWAAALLASLLSLGRLFADDYRDGTLEQMLLSPYPNTVLALGKAIAHWIINGIPLLLIAPVLGIQFGLPATFVVTDTAKSIPVSCTGILPDLFKEGKGVVAEGRLGSDGLFTATQVLAKHGGTTCRRKPPVRWSRRRRHRRRWCSNFDIPRRRTHLDGRPSWK